MGQQQLLLLVLGIVIVGLAVVVGINAFSENRVKSNADALVTDGLRIVSDLQAWALKPTQFGGNNDGIANTNDLDNTNAPVAGLLGSLGYDPDNDDLYTNVNGIFTFTTPSGVTCDAPETGSETALKTLYAYNEDTSNCVAVAVTGTLANNIYTQVTYGS